MSPEPALRQRNPVRWLGTARVLDARDRRATEATIRATIMRDRRSGRWFAIVEHTGTGTPAQAIIYQPTHAEAVQAALAMLALIERIAMDEVHASRASRRDTRPSCSCSKLPGIHIAADCDAMTPPAPPGVCWCSHDLDQHTSNAFEWCEVLDCPCMRFYRVTYAVSA